jgi:hypothetical protein
MRKEAPVQRGIPIRNTRISTASVTPHARNPGEAPRRSFQSRRCHLFHLFYQVHIRLGSPHSSAGCFRYLYPNRTIAPARPIAQRSPSALSRSSMRREHCGNFSVAHLVMSAEALQRAGGYPPPRRAARCSVLSCSRETVVQAHAVVLHARAAQSSEKIRKVRGLHVIA